MKLLGWVLMLPLLYLAAGAIGGSIPRNLDWREPDQGITIYVATNGIHTGLVLPTRAGGVDWSPVVPPQDIADPRYAGRWLWFGWGERDFYLNTPTWRKFSPRTAFHALAGSSHSLMHVDHLLEPWGDARPIRVTPDQYRRVTAAIRASFDPDRHQPIRGYDVADVFYPARGSYNAIRTCNWWTGHMLAQAGIRIGAWTPFSATVMQWFPRAG